MKNFLRNKKKLMIVVMLLLVTLVGCGSPRGKSGKTYLDQVITMEKTTITKNDIEIKENSEEFKKYENYTDDQIIEIEKTTFKDMMDEGWFSAIVIYPIAQLINIIASFTDAGIGIIAVTFLIQLLVFVFSIRSQVATQKMQLIQPELKKIQAKYAGKTDERSQMAQAQEMQNLYAKHKINPFGTIIVTFIQLPIILGMYQATMRAYSVLTGSFMGIQLSNTPMWGFKNLQIAYIVVFLLMVLFQFLSMKTPQWLQERHKKQAKIKEKKYLKQDNSGMPNPNTMNYMMVAMVALFAINWPLAMSFYWLVGSVFRVVQSLVIDKFFMNKKEG